MNRFRCKQLKSPMVLGFNAPVTRFFTDAVEKHAQAAEVDSLTLCLFSRITACLISEGMPKRVPFYYGDCGQ
jgi:hypothetical protein